MRPRIFVTRKLPEAVEARLQRDYDARLNPEDAVYREAELLAGAEGADGIVTSPTERFGAGLVDRLPASVRIIATFSVGYDHVDVEAGREQAAGAQGRQQGRVVDERAAGRGDHHRPFGQQADRPLVQEVPRPLPARGVERQELAACQE